MADDDTGQGLLRSARPAHPSRRLRRRFPAAVQGEVARPRRVSPPWSGFDRHRRRGDRHPGQRLRAGILVMGVALTVSRGVAAVQAAVDPPVADHPRRRGGWPNIRPEVSCSHRAAAESCWRHEPPDGAWSAICGSPAPGCTPTTCCPGLPFIFLAQSTGRTRWPPCTPSCCAPLPSGASIAGLTAAGADPQHHPPDAVCAPRSAPGGGRAAPAPRRGPGSRTAASWEPTLAGHRPRRRIYWLSPAAGLRPGRAHHRRRRGGAGWTRSSARDNDTDGVAAAYRRPGRADGGRAAAGVFRQTGQRRTDLVALELHRQPRGVAPSAAATALRPACPAAGLGVHPGVLRPVGGAVCGAGGWRAARSDAEVFVRTYRDRDDERARLVSGADPAGQFPRHRHRLAQGHASSRCSTT